MFRRVLITGGAGFIGASVSAELVRRGHEVVCLDVSAGDRLSSLAPAAHLVTGDVRDGSLVDRLVVESDLVLHLAAVVGVDEYLRRPLEVLDVNILGTRHVVESCLRHARPVLLASTSEVYGKNPMPLFEGADKVIGSLGSARWAYAVSKAAGEEYAHALGREGLVFTIARYFNVYGPLMDSVGTGRVISKFLGFIRDGKPLPLVDGGDAVRTFCYIDDAVEATLRMALGLVRDASWQGRAVNIGREVPTRIRELAAHMIRLSGHRAGTVAVPGTEHFGPGFEEIVRRVPDASFLRSALAFEPLIDLDDGLRRTLAPWGLLRSDASEEAVPDDVIPTIQPRFEPTNALMEQVALTLWSGKLSNGGPAVSAFEQEAAAWLGSDGVAAVSSGTDALALAIEALAPGPGAAILPSYTFMATLSAVVRCGLRPVFCEVDPRRWTMDPSDLERLLAATPDARLVVPVNVFGMPPDLPAIMTVARAHGVEVVYDDAHGFGTSAHGARLPDGPAAVALSLHATKIVPVGEGGLVASGDPALMREVRRLRNHGLAGDPLASTPGHNAKMCELRGHLGLQGLHALPDVLARRREYAMRIRAAAGQGPLVPQIVPEGIEPNWQNLGVRCTADGGIEPVVEAFLRCGVEARRYFWPPLHRLGTWNGAFDLPRTDAVADSVVCLPIHSRMSGQVLERLEAAVRQVSEWLET